MARGMEHRLCVLIGIWNKRSCSIAGHVGQSGHVDRYVHGASPVRLDRYVHGEASVYNM